jgi:hypothetical protein
MNTVTAVLSTFNLPVISPHKFHEVCEPLCTLTHDEETYIKYSNVPFLCFMTDHRFPDEMILHIMKPYICDLSDDEESDYPIGYGWLYCGSDDWCDNLYHPVHGDTYDDRKVIGFIKL